MRLFAAAFVVCLAAAPAGAACFADYKAKKDAPLRLHYGVMELPDAVCGNTRAASQVMAQRLSRGGWQLLNVLGFFDARGAASRRQTAGEYYLRF
ncbi:hypothetical protein DXV76_19885 [Rhodobacteraceae bacterium CCMM004]|nr:hypothetical protein DXV76_19885 [Rhodobacteraceae bacterium CCMM004]